VNLPADFPKDTLKRRSEWQFPNVIDLLAAELSKKPGNEGIQVYYEYFETTLSAAIVKRKGDFFKEPDVWLIVDQLR
jgi:hypothetical protein